ncbi:MAG TPA: DUF370 domain-containing protein [Peptococcaceae bacterium]|mgnify:CR=1 FL=1|jgi:hypothetical protein|nr:DUF370 domain-containing protein [Peptococcaceae bacterium]HPZ70627.1 DUF370 domain-containing protein [Peptococcaceae bacterium]HQD54238.1 DUF370 domain-containing protein [Peptococcaceae bacterium]
MFLHLGSDVSVFKREIIGIFDYKLIKKSRITKEFIDVAAHEHLIKKGKKPKKIKSFILTTGNVYFSPISAETLQKRMLGVLDAFSAESER